MKKTILLSGLLIILALSTNSCKKCYTCSQSLTGTLANYPDSVVTLTIQECSGKNGAGNNLNVTIQDIEANGYICTEK